MPPTDDDSDAPPRRRRDDDDFDDRDRDRPPPRKGMSGGMLGLIIGLVVVFLACPVIAILIGLLLPAVQKVREAAGRAQDANNLKQIGLGQFNAESATGQGFVGPFAYDPQARQVRTGNSFRVSLLPYVEQDNLYRQFDLTQPWDGPRNKPAADTVLKVYTTPLAPPPNPTDTPYRVFYGGGALFDEAGTPVTVGQIADGMSNTILMVHAQEQVPWAKPAELKYSPNAPLPPLGPANMNGYNVLMADGSVRFLKKTTSEATLRKLITRAGGEVHDPNEF